MLKLPSLPEEGVRVVSFQTPAVRVIAFLFLALLVACHNSQPTRSSPSAIAALDECDPAGYVPCIQQSSFLSYSVVDSGLLLTYSSGWKTANKQGLGSWSFNVIQQYDPSTRILFSGDGSWRLTDSIVLPSGERAVPSYDGALAYVFDRAGRHIRTMDGHLGTPVMKIAYDQAGHLSKIDGTLDGEPVHVSVQRDPSGKARSLIGTDGAITGLQIDDNGRLAAMISPAGGRTSIVWNSAGLVKSLIDPADNTTTFAYDNSGHLSLATDADGVSYRFDRTNLTNGMEIRLSTKLGRHWSYRAESMNGGMRRTYITADGTTTTETIDAHETREMQFADGRTFTVGAVSNPVWGLASPILTPIVAKRPDGITSRRDVKYSLQRQSDLPYLLAGSVTTTINGQSWIEKYDPAHRTETLIDPSKRQSISSYDSDGRLLNQSTPGTAPVVYKYDTNGRITSETKGTGNLSQITGYSYDSNGGQITVTRPDGAVERTAFDKDGSIASKSAFDGSTLIAGYNASGRLTKLQPPGGLNFILGASPAGRPTAFVPPATDQDSSIETRSYDADGNLVKITGPGKRLINLSYDSDGRLSGWTFNRGKCALTYDAHSGLPKQSNDPGGTITSYGYAADVLNRLAWSGSIAGSVSVRSDANDRIADEAVNGTNQLSYRYDPSGNLIGIGSMSLTRDRVNGLVTSTAVGAVQTNASYDANDQLARSTTTAAGRILFDQQYTHDTRGRIKSITETASDGKSTKFEYSYDKTDRLTEIRVNGDATETESYDAAGNRIDVVRHAQKIHASYDARNELSKWGTTEYSWGPDGNLTTRKDQSGTTSFVYDDLGALREATLPDGRKIKYLVDCEGRRVGKQIDGKFAGGYLYRPDGFIAAETDSNGKIVSHFGYDDQSHLAVVEKNGITYRIITDAIGSPRMLVNSQTGEVIGRISYDAWGTVTQDTAPGFIPIGFAGGLRDADTGLVRFGARDYDPQTGRWTAADPIRFDSGDSNLYLYVASNPVNRVDPTGTVPHAKPPATHPPQNGKPPQNNNISGVCPGCLEPQAGSTNPPNYNPPQSPWKCSGAACQAPGGTKKNDWGCEHGECGGGANGFWCKAQHCTGPGGGDLCLAAPGSTCSWGEPHFQTSDGLHFDFQVAGEFLMALSTDKNFVIQARQEASSADAQVTMNTAVAANVNGDHVGVYAKEPSYLMLNGNPVKESDIEKRLPHGGSLQRHGSTVNLIWPDGSQLSVTSAGMLLNYSYNQNPSAALRGVLGTSNTASPDLLMSRDGIPLKHSDPDFQNKLYKQFANSWRIKQDESLFDYWPGESTATFTKLDFPAKHVSAGTLSSAAHSSAEAVCRAVGVHIQPALDDCILDVGITGKTALASASVAFASAPVHSQPALQPAVQAKPAVASVPTGISDQFKIKIGELVSPDHPAKGAGIITNPQQRQTYSFDAHAGQIAYLGIGPCEGPPFFLDILLPDHYRLDGQLGCHDLGRVVLPQSGTYQIVAKTDKVPVRYNFALLNVPPDRHFSMTLPLTVSAGVSGGGAGHITAKGEQHQYDFTAKEGTTVHIESKCSCGNLAIRVTVANDTGRIGYLDLNHLNFDWKLPAGGKYTIQVLSTGYVGNYSFTASQPPRSN